jgi:hypothetical protein
MSPNPCQKRAKRCAVCAKYVRLCAKFDRICSPLHLKDPRKHGTSNNASETNAPNKLPLPRFSIRTETNSPPWVGAAGPTTGKQRRGSPQAGRRRRAGLQTAQAGQRSGSRTRARDQQVQTRKHNWRCAKIARLSVHRSPFIVAA